MSTDSGQTSPSSPPSPVYHGQEEVNRDFNPRSRQRVKLRDQDRKAICVYHLERPNARQRDIAGIFGVEWSTVSKILKDKDHWLDISADDTQGNSASDFSEVEREMIKFLQSWTNRGGNITDQVLRERLLEVAQSFGMPAEKFTRSTG